MRSMHGIGTPRSPAMHFHGLDLNLLPVFNVADASIGVGIFAIVFFQRRFLKFGKTNAEPPTQPEVAAVVEHESTTPPSAQ